MTVKCKHDVVFLLTQPPSPPVEPSKDSNASKKPLSKGKATASSQQVVLPQPAALQT